MRYVKKCLWMGLLFTLGFTLTLGGGQVKAKDKYPTRAIEIIVPFGPGASTDLSTRVVAEHIKKRWGVPVNVVNKKGGNTVPGTLELYNAAPDGYSMFSENQNSAVMLGIVIKDLPFKITDRTFIARTIASPLVILVPSDSPHKTLEDLAAVAKKDPGSFTWTSLGGTGTQDVTALQFFKTFGIDAEKTKPIIAGGGAKAVALAAGGHVVMGIGTASGSQASINSGVVRPIGITSDIRFPDLPEIPTFKQLGYPGISCMYWVGISGPPNLPKDIVKKWSNTLEKLSKDAEFKEQMRKVGVIVQYMGHRELRQQVIKETEEMKALGVRKREE